MKYAINTLNIELNKQLEAIRVVNRYSAYPEYQGSSESFERNVSELHSAIERLQSSEQGESPATDRQHTQHAIAALRSVLSTLPVNLGMVDQIIVAFELELQQHASA